MMLTIEMPDEMVMYAGDIHKFVDLMIHKLHKNMHKGRWDNMSVIGAFNELNHEVDELIDAIRSNDTNEIYLESADVANFAMIIASITRERGVDNGTD